MRILIAVPLLLLGACNVAKDNANNTVSVTVNEEVAGNTLKDVGNEVQNVAQDVGNDVQRTGDKLQNTDVDVNVNTNTQAKKH